MANPDRLSSDHLYTYMWTLDVLKLILKNGVRHSLNTEILPYKGSKQLNFIACFCDILPEQAGYHRKVYGPYGIVLTKDWAIENSVTPIRYVHKGSAGVSRDYVLLKNDLRTARTDLSKHGSIEFLQSLILHRTARDRGILTGDSIYSGPRSAELEEYLGAFDKVFDAMVARIGGNDNAVAIFDEWIKPVIDTLVKAVNELEMRDSLVRTYEGPFRDEPNKVFYDEREWRSVKYVSEAESKRDPDLYRTALDNKYLPPDYNLKIANGDLVAILVEKNEEKDDIQKYLSDNGLFTNSAELLIETFDEHLNRA